MSRANGYIGSIRSVYWRRAAIICIAIPHMLWGVVPEMLWRFPGVLWRALGDAWTAISDEFVFVYSTPIHMLAKAAAHCWSADYEPAEESE